MVSAAPGAWDDVIDVVMTRVRAGTTTHDASMPITRQDGRHDVLAPLPAARVGQRWMDGARPDLRAARDSADGWRAHSPSLLPASVTMTPAELSYSGFRSMRTGVLVGTSNIPVESNIHSNSRFGEKPPKGVFSTACSNKVLEVVGVVGVSNLRLLQHGSALRALGGQNGGCWRCWILLE